MGFYIACNSLSHIAMGEIHNKITSHEVTGLLYLIILIFLKGEVNYLN